jgi:hypothetical protein
MSITAMQQALEALEYEANRGNDNAYQRERDALRTAIAEAKKQEPVAWVCNHYEAGVKNDVDYWQDDIDALPVGTPLYTTPPAAQRQPQYNKTEMNCFVQTLYDEKMREGKRGHYETMFHVVHRAIEAAHGITGEKT